MTPPPSICLSCRQPLQSHFQIVHYDASKTPTMTVTVCSIKCLVTWAYEYATLTGVKAVYQTKSFITGIVDMLKGSKS